MNRDFRGQTRAVVAQDGSHGHHYVVNRIVPLNDQRVKALALQNISGCWRVKGPMDDLLIQWCAHLDDESVQFIRTGFIMVDTNGNGRD